VTTTKNGRFQIAISSCAGEWSARALRADTGAPFGIECRRASEEEAVDLLTRWLDWQQEHSTALSDLQEAERVYHRAVAARALAQEDTGGSVEALLRRVNDSRNCLDTIRARRPEVDDLAADN
jgi:hypothetical protein